MADTAADRVGTVKLTAFLIRKLVTAGKPQP